MTSRTFVVYAGRHVVRESYPARRLANRLIERERWPAERLQALQDELLARTLETAARRIPAYAHLPTEVRPEEARELLATQVPIVGKDDLRAERERLYPNRGRAQPWWSVGRTSGTTGSPLEVFRSFASTVWEHAFHLQHWHWAGCTPQDRQVVLRGDLIAPLERDEPPFWFHDRVGRQLIVSTRHLTPRHLPAIAAAIGDFDARLLRAYPSAAHRLAQLCADQGPALKFDIVITGSEMLYPLQREALESGFGARVMDFYGLAERVAFAAECEHGRLHAHPEYSVIEVVDDDGRPTDGEGFLVGTTLHNRTMPLLRYRTNDRTRWRMEACPCGRCYPTLAPIAGKYEEQVYDLDGQPVSPSVITFAFKGVPHIERAQVAQVDADRWVLRVVPEHGFDAANERLLLSNFSSRVSRRLNVEVQLTPELPLERSGKYRWVRQEWRRAA